MKIFLLKTFYKITGFFASQYLEKHGPQIIGITGGVGKTSCRMIITKVLSQVFPDKKIYTSPENFNSEIGIVLSIFQIEKYTPNMSSTLSLFLTIFKKLFLGEKPYDSIILEYGVDHPGDMNHLLWVARPDIAIYTQSDEVHSQYFPADYTITDEELLLIFNAKGKKYIFAEDDCVVKKTQSVETSLYGGENYGGEDISLSFEKGKIKAQFVYKNQLVTTNVIGDENIRYIFLALDIAGELGSTFERDKYHFDIPMQAGRWNLFQKADSIFIDSTYNAAPQSMVMMIKNTKNLQKKLFQNHKIGVCIGDMRELGEKSEEAHKSIAEILLDMDFVVTVGKEMNSYLLPTLEEKGYTNIVKNFRNSRAAGNYIKQTFLGGKEKYIILFKGSQNTIFVEEALACLISEEERKNLVRQSPKWIEKKNTFFNASISEGVKS